MSSRSKYCTFKIGTSTIVEKEGVPAISKKGGYTFINLPALMPVS